MDVFPLVLMKFNQSQVTEVPFKFMAFVTKESVLDSQTELTLC